MKEATELDQARLRRTQSRGTRSNRVHEIEMQYVQRAYPEGEKPKIAVYSDGQVPEVQILEVTPIGPDMRWTYVLIWR